MFWNSHYYAGFISAKKADFEKLKNLGVYFERSGIEIFEKMLADFKEMEEKLKNVAKPEGDSRSGYPELSEVLAAIKKMDQYCYLPGTGNQCIFEETVYVPGYGNYVNIDDVIKILREHFR